jgi:hypothetical protein
MSTGDGRRCPAGGPPEGRVEVPVEAGVGCIEELAARDRDDVEAACTSEGGAPAKNLTNQAFCAIPPHGIPELLRSHDSQPRSARIPLRHDEREIPAVRAAAGLEHPLELRP